MEDIKEDVVLQKEMVNKLRNETGAGFGACLFTLRDFNFDYEAALQYLKDNYPFHMYKK